MHPPESVSGLLSRTPSPSRGAPPRAGYEALSASIRKILQENNLDEVLRTICEEACRVLGADCSLVEQVVSHPLLSHSTLFSHNLQSDFLEACQGHPHSGSILSDVLERRELEVVQDPALDPRPPHAEALQRLGCRTVCVMPLVVSETPFGGSISTEMANFFFRNFISGYGQFFSGFCPV